MAASGRRAAVMQKFSSPPSSLSSPPSALSEPVSPTRFLNAGRANIEMDEIIVDPGSVPRFGVMQQQAQALNPPPPNVPLTAAGLPRKKPGRKPGSTVKPKVAADGSVEPPKQRRPRKPKDPNAPPIQRKRKTAPTESGDGPTPMDIDSRSFSGPSGGRQPKITELTSMRMSIEPRLTPTPVVAGTATVPTNTSEPQFLYAQKVPKREGAPVSMQSLLNDDPPPKPQPQPAAPARQMFDPIRGNYDPIRETMVARDPYGTGPLGSPRAPTQVVNRASASPSIASLVDPPVASNMISPVPSQTYNAAAQSRFHDSNSLPPSPSHPTRPGPQHLVKPDIIEVKRPPPPQPAPAPMASSKPEAKTTSFTSMSTIPTASAAFVAVKPTPSAPVQSKKLAAVAQQDREANKKASSNSSSPRISSLRDALPSIPAGSERSILDFGKASPGEEMNAPSIVLHIPLNGETNKYVNFMRMAEESYGWDALHPRLAANRERKARIAAASAALEKTGSGRESADEMDEDLQSDGDASNVEMGGMTNGAGGGGTSGLDGAPAKPARKKRNFKEDEYDKDDDFVDDSELLWEEQAAATQNGFFVYSGPLVQEEEKPVIPTGPPRRGRGGGRGSRGGGRGGAARGEGTGRGRGGGPGSRGGAVTRKPRITKLEKEQRDKEKAEREKLAQMGSSGKGAAASSASGAYSGASLLGLPGQAGTAATASVVL